MDEAGEIVSKVTAMRYLDTDGDYVYVSRVSDNHEGGYYINVAYNLDEAYDFVNTDKEELMKILEGFQDYYDDMDCEVVKITIRTTTEDIMMDDPEFKELRQKHALDKLTEKEIKALGLVPIAVYIKTKFHNA